MTVKTYSCPKCGRDVTIKDINVSKDIMLCPACGEVSVFSEVVDRLKAANDEDAERRLLNLPPPRHLKVESDTTQGTGRIICTYRRFSPLAVFFIPFTAIWAGGSMWVNYGTQIVAHRFELFPTLFGIPFLIGSLFLIALCLFLSGIGKLVLTLERGKGKCFWGVGPVGYSRKFTYGRTSAIELQRTAFQSNRQRGLEIQLTNPYNADKVRVCRGIGEDAVTYLAALLKREARTV